MALDKMYSSDNSMLSSHKIPIKNIYYLLSYAWDKLEESEKVDVNVSDYTSMIDLLSKILVNGVVQLLKRGLDKQYIEREDDISSIKGKINFTQSINRNLFSNAKASCTYDEFDVNIINNQILKSTMYRLLRSSEVDRSIRNEIKTIYFKFNEVSLIDLKSSDFKKIKIHRNNYFYDFLLKVCKLIHDQQVFDEGNGEYRFTDFIRDDKKMPYLFESFVLNFYKKEFKGIFHASSKRLHFKFLPIGDSDKNLLPSMLTDIFLESKEKRIIIDTKYYPKALAQRSYKNKDGSESVNETFKSNNIYQMFTYLKHSEEVGNDKTFTSEGMLLYPTVNYNLDQEFEYERHKISFRTLDLSKSWKEIDAKLRSFVE
tara:strand:+ start:2022 stop:3134 length:1113 start_codon:yes stop_codon:yes gene_type:complete